MCILKKYIIKNMLSNIKNFIKVVLSGSTRTHVATFEQRELYADIDIAKIINEK